MEPTSESALVPVVQHSLQPATRHTATYLDPLVDPYADDLKHVVGEWLLSLPSDPTREVYSRELRKFIAWLKGEAPNVGVLNVHRTAIDAYRRHLIVSPKVSTASAKKAITVLRSFYDYCASADYIDKDPAAKVKPPTVQPIGKTPGVSQADGGAVLQAARKDGPRTYALVLLLAATGVRISEALSMRLEGLQQHHNHEDGRTYWRIMVERKRNKDDWVTIPDGVRNAILAMAEHEGRTEGWMFRTKNGTPMDRVSAWKKLRAIGVDEASMAKLSPHMMRVAAITTAAANGVAERRIQQMAAHANFDTTARYIREASADANSPTHVLDVIWRTAEANARTAADARLDGGATLRMPHPPKENE
ncbi:tyrosine-type recombinase/integrase [Actinopolymorpha sp. B17G11]|uniref:tyrosine-type recombinase/integrase n=1 Tax=Actinopolymorpha sp. B17G11 TaxID=3160861 RepID=UPI0032E3D888